MNCGFWIRPYNNKISKTLEESLLQLTLPRRAGFFGSRPARSWEHRRVLMFQSGVRQLSASNMVHTSLPRATRDRGSAG